jgi:RNA polymerase sigma-70 factor (ECF subfamily)
MRTLRRLGVAERDVEDYAHEVFLAVHRELPKYDPGRPIRPWLFAFCFRVASHYRRKARREVIDETTAEREDLREGADAVVEREQQRRLVLLALDGLELERRAVFVLHELDGVTCEQIARTLEIPVGTVYSRLRVAREEFAAKVKRLESKRRPP